MATARKELRTSAGRRLVAAALPLLPWLWLGCQGAVRPPEAGFIHTWAVGPARWLMLPEEERQLERVRTHAEAVAFVEAFWRRRDPDGKSPGNPFEQEFHRRVEAADRLYGEGATRGSLTDRGRALILLGPPPALAYDLRPVPAWNPGRLGGHPAFETRHLSTESWRYAAEDLAPRLRALLAEEEREPEVTLVFAVEPARTYLTDGERFLAAAVRAALVEEAAEPPG